MAEAKKPGIFNKVLEATETALESYIAKARSDIASEDDNAFYSKAVYRDLSMNTGSQGYHEKGSQMTFSYQAQMSKKDTIVAAIIQTLQNKIGAHAVIARDKHSKGFKVKLKNEEDAIQEIMEELFGKDEDSKSASKRDDAEGKSGEHRDVVNEDQASPDQQLGKAQDEGSDDIEMMEEPVDQPDGPTSAQIPGKEDDQEALPGDTNKDGELSDKEKRRRAKEELTKRNKKKIEALQNLLLTCGDLEDKPFEHRKWNLEAFLRAIVRDRLTYDQIAVELVPDQAGRLHHWYPVDGGTIRFASPALGKFKDIQSQTAGYDLLYPEKELKALEEQTDAITLDDEKLENDDYKYVQLVRGRIVRAFTPDELAFGMANPTTDIYTNGYSVSELELLVNMVSAHIFTENYNRSYFTQGFSAKGILHIKAPLNRRKLETVRVQWNHMIKGNRNSFQTPIMAGMDDIKWIPLTQSHSDMEFNNWMNYLIKIICAIYQIDPFEIGFGMKDEGGSSGGGLSGDNSKQKMEVSKNKGFVPLLRFLQNYINTNIMSRLDPDFEMEFVGIDEDSKEATIERQNKEVKFKKSVNEIRAEDDLPPIAGADDLILDPTFFQWFTAFHPDGKKNAEAMSMDQQIGGIQDQVGADAQGEDQAMQSQLDNEEERMNQEEQSQNDQVEQALNGIDEQLSPPQKKPLKKSLTNKLQKIAIEYYSLRGK